MIDIRNIQERFKRCGEPIDFMYKYSLFKKSNNIEETNEIIEILQCIENIERLGALYIAELKEESVREIYIDQFIDRNKELIIDKIQNDNDNIVYFMQILYLCLMNVRKERCLELCKEIFSGNVYRRLEPEKVEFEKRGYVSKHYAAVFLSAVTNFPTQIAWGKKYCRIVTAIFKARNEDMSFLHMVEVELRKHTLGYYIDEASAKEYFDLLCKHGAYDCAKYFLDNFDDCKMALGMQSQDFVAMLYSLPSPELFSSGKKYLTKVLHQEYTYDEWLADVVKYNHDAECIKWIKLTVYYHSLKECVEVGDINGFEKRLECADNFELFDLDKIKYMKQIVKCVAFIINNLLILSYKNLINFLKTIENINVNEYSRMKYLSGWDQLESIKNEYDYAQIKNSLFENYQVAEVIFIYMNSHLKYFINIEELVEFCAEKNGEEVYELFKSYPLRGQISRGSRLNSVRDKIFITPIGVASDISFQHYQDVVEQYGYRSPQAQKVYNKLIRSAEDWYSHNKEIAELMSDRDYCVFYIQTYKKYGGILATDISLYDNIKMQRIKERNTIYPDKLICWLTQIQASGNYHKWDYKNDYIFGVRHLENNSVRNKIALEILNTILSLQSNISELEGFIEDITHPPLEEINDFRYIPIQRGLGFIWDSFDEVRNQILNKADIIMRNENISIELRKTIYLNTCIRKFYDLQEACRYVGGELYATPDRLFVMALKFECREQGSYYFSTRWKNNTFYSTQRFKYDGEEFDLIPGKYIYLATLKKYDSKERCFVLEKVGLTKEQISQSEDFYRRIRDIQLTTDSSELEKIKKELEKCQIKVTSDFHIRKFAHELNEIFKKRNYDMDSVLTALNVVENKNPFRNSDKDFRSFAKDFYESYYESYSRFLENYREQSTSAWGFCDLFFSSYLKVFISYDDFLNDIVDDEMDRQNTLNYCNLKGYIHQ